MNDNPRVPHRHQLTPAELADHDRSVHDYPNINFSPTEYVVIDVQRSIWGLIGIWLFALVVFVVFAVTAIMIKQTTPIELNPGAMVGLLCITVSVPILIGLVGTYVYRRNSFIVTNERVFARIQYTPFASRNQNVELEHIEDCSYIQSNPVQLLLNYGTIRLSTVSDEQTYIFNYVDDPKNQFKIVNRVVQEVDAYRTTKYHPTEDDQ